MSMRERIGEAVQDGVSDWAGPREERGKWHGRLARLAMAQGKKGEEGEVGRDWARRGRGEEMSPSAFSIYAFHSLFPRI